MEVEGATTGLLGMIADFQIGTTSWPYFVKKGLANGKGRQFPFPATAVRKQRAAGPRADHSPHMRVVLRNQRSS
jgi:hypothetical protein